MEKIFKQMRFLIRNISRVIIGTLLSFIVKREKNILIFSGIFSDLNRNSRDNNIFMHNTKYLFLYLNSHQTEFKTYWLCSDKQMVKDFNIKGYKNVLYKKNLKSIYYCLKAKYFLHDFSAYFIPIWLLNNAIIINMWHATGGLKKAIYDDKRHTLKSKLNKFSSVIYDKLRLKDNFYTTDSDNQRKIKISEFDTTDNTIITTGSPRIDVLYHDFKDENMFIENDYQNIKSFKEQGKKLFFYTPTWRDTGVDVSSWLKSDKLKSFLINNNAVLVCKLHPADKNSLNFELGQEIYKMDSKSDIYPVLKFSDAMIADYSSIYFDYLNLDKPVLHFVPDLDEFQAECREFYDPYEVTAAGPITYSEDELLDEMLNVLNGIDNYSEKRKKMRDELFTYQDGKNCERVIEFIKGLNN